VSLGAEYFLGRALFHQAGQFFAAGDTSYRSAFSSSATPSKYLFVDGYSLVNVRTGFRAADGWTVSVWARNLFDTEYYDLLSAAPGNSGLIVGQPGDGRTFGVTVRLSLRRR
jgi:iron complex outermembrane receptor protein